LVRITGRRWLWLHWSRPTKKNGGGYGVIAYDEHYREDDPNKKQHVEPWLITIDLIECIALFYECNVTSENVKVIQEQENDDAKEAVEADILEDLEAEFYKSWYWSINMWHEIQLSISSYIDNIL
jgi:hypothetical protein